MKIQRRDARNLRQTFSDPAYHTLMSALVLVVEDEPQIAAVLEAYLKQEGHRVEKAADGKAALSLYRAARPDLLLLDLMLPGLSGMDVLKAVRADGQTPVILVTARAEETDQVLGLEFGADDYVVKPFRPREVMARVKAVLRRTSARTDGGAPQVYRIADLEIDTGAVLARLDGHVLSLTPAEFRLLACMAATPGRAFTRAELLAAALPESEALERVVDAHLASARRKLEAAGGTGLLQTVRGVGYRLSESG
ncbi:DNA-binding response regulator [Deinococcus aquiradiocola]|uniref:DNA-binding response regulator n=2 Tax=Deinococcus aquiradiocola TaxID=393059 RepID=A0A917URM4_9DEIO|nr:DNA-binding response regulator [Deinococcus aquiradiocola]